MMIPGDDTSVPIEMGKQQHGTAKAAIRWTVFALIVVVLAISFTDAFRSSWDRLQEQPIELSWHLAAALVLFVLAVPISGILAGKILQRVSGKQISNNAAIKVHIVSWILKYIPGQAGSLAYKLFWGNKNGFGLKPMTLSFFYENVFLQLASFLFGGAVILWLIPSGALPKNYGLLGAALVCSLAVGLFAVNRLAHRILSRSRVANEPSAEKPKLLSTADMVRFTALYILPRLPNAVGFGLIVMSLTSLSGSQFILVGGAYVLAGAIGILAIFVPSGLGVREGVVVALIGASIGYDIAIIAAVLARFVSILADGVLLAWATAAGSTRKLGFE